MTEPKKFHCVSCLSTARVGDDIRHELNCPNLATAHNPDVSRVSYLTKTFTVQSTDPQVALATVSIWECSVCGALVDEQWRHTLWHTNEAKRMYELQRRTNRVRVKRPKETAPKKGRVPKTMPKNSPSQNTDDDSNNGSPMQRRVKKPSQPSSETQPDTNSGVTPSSTGEPTATVGQRRRVKKRTPKRHIVTLCQAAKDIGVRVGGEQHTCDCELPMNPEHEMHRCSVCKIGWNEADEEWNPPDWTVPQGNVTSNVHGQVMHNASGEIATLCNIEHRDPTAPVRLTDERRHITCPDCIRVLDERERQQAPLPNLPTPITPVTHEVKMKAMREIANADKNPQTQIEEVQISEELLEALLEDQGLREQATAIKNAGNMGTLLGIPFVVDDRLSGGDINIVKRPRTRNRVVMPPINA